ncbi:MAG: hypothetical protein OEW64_03775 [Gammaproteobacteria bacterium]|nr:hypothetical protein [Gammaproteobacteria bacterium]
MLTVFILLPMAGCASVTTYGFGPEEIAPGLYNIALYYNAYASDEDIDRKAAEIAEQIRQHGNWGNCAFSRSAKVSPATVKEIHVRISCNVEQNFD